MTYEPGDIVLCTRCSIRIRTRKVITLYSQNRLKETHFNIEHPEQWQKIQVQLIQGSYSVGPPCSVVDDHVVSCPGIESFPPLLQRASADHDQLWQRAARVVRHCGTL